MPDDLNPHIPNFHNYFRRYRASLNPPYRKTDIFTVVLTIAILVAVPLTTVAVLNSRGDSIEAAPPLAAATESKENKAKRLTLSLFKNDKKFNKKASLKQIAKERKQALLNLMETDPGAVTEIAFDSKIRQKMPAEIKAETEEQVQLEGEVEVAHADDFTGKVAKYYYKLSAQGKEFDIRFGKRNPNLVSGSRIRVKGVKLDDKVAVAEGKEDLKVVAPPKVLAATQIKKVAVILFNFSSNTSQPWSASTVGGFVFTNSNSVKAFHKENSFNFIDMQGKNSVNGEVYGWYTISNSNSTCDYAAWGTAARNAATAAGANLTGYTQIIHMFPNTASCGWAGLAYLPGTYSFINGYLNLGVIAHELGHNFGAHHASSYSCTEGGTRVPISTSCTLSEYGDPFDTMGSGGGRHFNNFNKAREGFFDPVNTQTVTTNGTYTIYPVENDNSNVKALRIPRDISGSTVTKYYYLEYRRPFGFDSFTSTNPVVNGISVRLAPDYPSIVQTWLVDTVASTSSFSDAPLLVNQTFTDSIKGITIKTLSAGTTSATVQITMNNTNICTRADPTATISPASQWASAGELKNYTLSITNNDSSACSAASFSAVFSAPSGITSSPTTHNVSIAPGATSDIVFGVTSTVGKPNGFYGFSKTVTNSASGYQDFAFANYNIGEAVPPTIAINSPADGATVSGDVPVSVTATDNTGVVAVGYFVGNDLVGVSENSPFDYTWDSLSVVNGTYEFSAVAADGSGNNSVPDTITLTVNNPIKPGDVNGDNRIDALDLSALLSDWGSSDPASDLNNDGKVDILDLSTVISYWGT